VILSPHQLSELCALAEEATREAGELIARSRPSRIEHKPEGGSSPASTLVTEIDRQAEALILNILAPSLKKLDLGVLTEEQPDDGQRHHKDYFWCIDPLDGTLPFVEGTPGYAVSIALVSRTGESVVGVVYDPVNAVCYSAARGLGIARNESPWRPGSAARGSRLSLYLDRSAARAPYFDELKQQLALAAQTLGLEGFDIHIGSAAVMNACQVLEHPPAGYFKFPKPSPGGGSLWDFAATARLFHEAGAIATDFHGAPLDLNRPDSTFMNHRGVLFASDEAVAERIRRLAPTA
jgi:fructose-1,6-bisphosphatase/inositol monophosphatase family enzyme